MIVHNLEPNGQERVARTGTNGQAYYRDAELIGCELVSVLNVPREIRGSLGEVVCRTLAPTHWRNEVRFTFQGLGRVKWRRDYQPGRRD